MKYMNISLFKDSIISYQENYGFNFLKDVFRNKE